MPYAVAILVGLLVEIVVGLIQKAATSAAAFGALTLLIAGAWATCYLALQALASALSPIVPSYFVMIESWVVPPHLSLVMTTYLVASATIRTFRWFKETSLAAASGSGGSTSSGSSSS